jgi:hypothetical protein
LVEKNPEPRRGCIIVAKPIPKILLIPGGVIKKKEKGKRKKEYGNLLVIG